MRVLGVDTVSPFPSLALVGAGAAVERTMPRTAAEALPAEVAALLDGAGATLASLERVAVVSGPGSFTGLRSSVAFCRGLARALGIPLVLVPTFEAAFAAVPDPTDADVVLDAGRGEVHLARRRGGQIDGAPVRLPRAGIAHTVPVIDLDSASWLLARAAAEKASAEPPGADLGPIYGRKSAAEERFGP